MGAQGEHGCDVKMLFFMLALSGEIIYKMSITLC